MSEMIFHDAIKTKCSYRGQALLQWDFTGHSGSARQSTQMPEEVIDQILAWRDNERRTIGKPIGGCGGGIPFYPHERKFGYLITKLIQQEEQKND